MEQGAIQETPMEWVNFCEDLDDSGYDPNDWQPIFFQCIRDKTLFNNQTKGNFLIEALKNNERRLQKQRLATRSESTGKELFVGPTDTNSETRTRRLLDELQPRIQKIRAAALGMEKLFRSPRGVYNLWEQSRNDGADDLVAEFKKKLKKIFKGGDKKKACLVAEFQKGLKKVLKSGDGRTYSPEAEFQRMQKRGLKVLKGDDKRKAWLESELQGMLPKVLTAWFEAKFQARLKKALKGGDAWEAWTALILYGDSRELRALKPLVVNLAKQTGFRQSDLIRLILTGREIHLPRWRIIGRQSHFDLDPRESEPKPVKGNPVFRGWTVEVNAPYLTKEDTDQIRSKLNRFRPDGFPLGTPLEVIEKAIVLVECNPEPSNDEEWEKVRQAVNKLYGYERYADLTGPKKCFQRTLAKEHAHDVVESRLPE